MAGVAAAVVAAGAAVAAGVAAAGVAVGVAAKEAAANTVVNKRAAKFFMEYLSVVEEEKPPKPWSDSSTAAEYKLLTQINIYLGQPQALLVVNDDQHLGGLNARSP